jgi:hypothetical protein
MLQASPSSVMSGGFSTEPLKFIMQCVPTGKEYVFKFFSPTRSVGNCNYRAVMLNPEELHSSGRTIQFLSVPCRTIEMLRFSRSG